jgi:hypothetical protein
MTFANFQFVFLKKKQVLSGIVFGDAYFAGLAAQNAEGIYGVCIDV